MMSLIAVISVVAMCCLVVQAQVTCPPVPAPAPGSTELDLTVESLYFLYVDGTLINDPPNYDNPTSADKISLQPYTRLIALQAQMFGAHGGILGSVNTNAGSYLVTSSSWKCTATLASGWEQLGFNDTAWPSAFEIGLNGNHALLGYGCIADISPDANWIWTAAYTGSSRNRNVWCRGYLPLCTENNPCLNGGTCLPNSAALCLCPEGFIGQTCDIDLNPCRSSPCRNGGTCTNLGSGGGYSCQCNSNYTGSQCETFLNACESNPCMNGGTCINGGSFFRCSCSVYYTGSRCETGVPPSCGSILRTAANASLPSGWNLGCYIGVGDEIYWNTPCFALLQGLSYYGSYDQLLAAGGNFGCWTTRDSTSSDIYNACFNNYQQNIYIRECSSCNFMAVCIRFP